jgi:hypothetical protein
MEHTYTPPLLDFTDSELPVEARYQMIKSMLAEYECIVEFKKVNGDIRTLPCTLKQDVLPAASQVLSEDIVDVAPNEGLITVWATDVQAWRAMKTMNVISVKLPPVRYTLTVEEDPKTGELFLPFTPEMLEQMGWKEGDTLSWDDNGDGSFMLSKKDKSSD